MYKHYLYNLYKMGLLLKYVLDKSTFWTYNIIMKGGENMVGNKLKELRTQKGYTISQLCKELEMNPNTYAKYERNERDVSTDTLSQLADFYGVTTDYLLGREEPKGEDIFDMLPIDDYSKTIVRVYAALNPKERQNFVDTVRKIANEAELILKEPEEKLTQMTAVKSVDLYADYADSDEDNAQTA